MSRAQLRKGQATWDFNMELANVEYSAMAKASGESLYHCSVRVPCMRNRKRLQPGERIFLEITKQSKGQTKEQQGQAWQQEVKKQDKKRKKEAAEGGRAAKGARSTPGEGVIWM